MTHLKNAQDKVFRQLPGKTCFIIPGDDPTPALKEEKKIGRQESSTKVHKSLLLINSFPEPLKNCRHVYYAADHILAAVLDLYAK